MGQIVHNLNWDSLPQPWHQTWRLAACHWLDISPLQAPTRVSRRGMIVCSEVAIAFADCVWWMIF